MVTLSDTVCTICFAVILGNQIIGPLLCKWGLVNSGETNYTDKKEAELCKAPDSNITPSASSLEISRSAANIGTLINTSMVLVGNGEKVLSVVRNLSESTGNIAIHIMILNKEDSTFWAGYSHIYNLLYINGAKAAHEVRDLPPRSPVKRPSLSGTSYKLL
jgi:hypothetical protein